ncbi:MAG: UbiD family decarboxylase [Magnetococcus sp. DMHC-6]
MTEHKAYFYDLRQFMTFLEERRLLVRVEVPVDPYLEITEICRRLLAKKGPAVLFTKVKGSHIPVLANLFGTQERVGLAIGRSLAGLEELGELLSKLRQPDPPRGFEEVISLASHFAQARHMPVRTVRHPACRHRIWRDSQVDLGILPIQTCWPGDAAPLVTWPLVITQGPRGGAINIGVYRLQVIGRNRLIMRWLPHRGGAQHFREFNGPMPVAVALGCDPGTLLAAVAPIPESLSEYAFAGLLRQKRVEVTPGLDHPSLPVPAWAEIVLEGVVDPADMADEGPFGDHTGYYNEVERFAVMTVHAMTMRHEPIYLSTFTGRPPDEPAILALAFNRIFTPLLRRQFPEIVAFHLPMEACSYRLAVVALRKSYPGHAFRVMVGLWGFLRQFLYTKYIIVVDADVDVNNWEAVLIAMGRHLHPGRDIQYFANTPIDYLDFASPQMGLGGKMGMDATQKIGPEQNPPIMAGEERPTAELLLLCQQQAPWIHGIHCLPGGAGVVLAMAKSSPRQGAETVAALWERVAPGRGLDRLWLMDDDLNPASEADLLWAISTRADPSRDLILDRPNGRFALDATHKLPEETQRVWGKVLGMNEETESLVTQRWPTYRLP